MKQLFSIVVALFLLAYPALAESCWATPTEMTACASEPSACCSANSNTANPAAHRAHSSAPSTENSKACAMCTVGAACAMIFETTTASFVPALRAERFGYLEEFGETRFEEPLLPPPRTVAAQTVS